MLSVFFIVVILLGVFFTMGYIAGRNAAPAITDAALVPKTEPSPAVSSLPPDPPVSRPEPAAPAGKERQEIEEPNRTESSKKSEAVRTEATKAEAVAPEPQPVKPERARPEKKERPDKRDREQKRSAASGQPQSGQPYLQLAATSRHEAEIMVDVLRKKGFKALTAEIEERPGTFRVLVGPIPEGGTNKLRSDLQGSGFPGNAGIRRTF